LFFIQPSFGFVADVVLPQLEMERAFVR
jgi:hypothetical protein